MFTKIESVFISDDKRRLFLNFLYLLALQGVNYALPLITLPYLIRVLGADKFGLYAFAQAFILYFSILTDYGFNLSATREIAINRENMEKVSEIYSSVMSVKFLILLFSFTVLSFIVLEFDKFRVDSLFYFMAFGMIIGEFFFPLWFFLGMEKMKYITYLSILSKLSFTILIFIFVRDSGDYMYVPLMNSLGAVIAGLIALKIVLFDFKVRFHLPKFSAIIHTFKDSTQFFLSRVSSMLYTSNNTFFLGLFTTNQMVGFYATAEKLNFALKGIYYPLSENLYPYMSKERKVNLFKKIFLLTVIFNTFLCFAVFSCSDQIIAIIFGEGLNISANILKIFSLSAIFSVPAILMGYPLLGAFGKAKIVNLTFIIGSVIHLTGLSLLALFSRINIYSVSIMVLITEILIFLVRLYFVLKTNYQENEA